MIVSDPSGHLRDLDHPARFRRSKPFADQIEIRDTVDLVVIGNAGVAVAEPDLRPHIQFALAAAQRRVTTKRPPRGPAVARKRPGDLLPAGNGRPRADIGGDTGEGANCDDQRGQQWSTHGLSSSLRGALATKQSRPFARLWIASSLCSSQ